MGMKTRAENSVVAGLMWLNQYKMNNEIHGDLLRYKCNQDNQLRFGWKRHDGVNFGEQDINEEDFTLSTKFVKRNLGGRGGDWTWRISDSVTFKI